MGAIDLALDGVLTAERPQLSRHHFQRLRFYWNGRARGQTLQGDNLDLDLVAHGYIRRREESSSWGGRHCYAITDAGELALVAEKERNVAIRSPHHDLGGRLAQGLRDKGRMTWEDVEFVVRRPNVSKLAASMGIAGYVERTAFMGVVRPDVFSLEPTHSEERFNPCVHEVKVSRADFLSDLKKPEKRLAYGCLAEAVYYVCPKGVIGLDEVPAGCGLLYETETGQFELVKRPRKRKVSLSVHDFMNLVLKHGRRELG